MSIEFECNGVCMLYSDDAPLALLYFMTRGRKKDLTIPASRALTQQRDYRARKAQYVSDLEARCRSAEEENVRLKKELDLARAGAPSVFSHQTVGHICFTRELIHNLR